MSQYKIIDLQNNGLNMRIYKNNIFIRNCKNMLKYDLENNNKILEKEIFKKDGKARSFFIIDSQQPPPKVVA